MKTIERKIKEIRSETAKEFWELLRCSESRNGQLELRCTRLE